MDKLEQYLDRVVRGIAGPRSLRQHIRQELREHLKDAAAEHVAAGLSDEQAMTRALEEFGGPEEVRAELEATHGHRWVTVVMDKAMSWKEKTMKARWLWSTWAHAVLCLTIAMELLFIAGVVIFILPKYFEIMKDRFIQRSGDPSGIVGWGTGFLRGLADVADSWIWILPAAGIGWAIFERAVTSENKALIRLTKLGTMATGLLAVVCLRSAALVLPLLVAVPTSGSLAPAEVITDTYRELDQLVEHFDRNNYREKEWYAARATVLLERLSDAHVRLERAAPGGGPGAWPARVDRARNALQEVQRALAQQDAERVQARLKEFQDAYAPLRAAASRPSDIGP